jgi:hypothetical protein
MNKGMSPLPSLINNCTQPHHCSTHRMEKPIPKAFQNINDIKGVADKKIPQNAV